MSATPEPPAKPSATGKITIKDLRAWTREGRKWPMLTCYDATTAKWLWRGGVRVILAGDSAAQVILGHDSTIHAPLDFMLAITAAVRRGAPDAFVMGDMPFMSYHADDAEAVRNAGRFLTQGLADAVKLEVDEQFEGTVRRIARASIPVVAHIGWRPQRLARTGSAVVAGRTPGKVQELVDLAKRLEDAGAVMLLLEASTAQAAAALVQAVSIPVIGCGAGPACHGHVVILQDLLGLTDWRPAFAPALADLGPAVAAAAKKWADLIAAGDYLRDDHPYHMNENR
jgi:3-methyl-2-oxobutanoate hydroxymethyltransferase